MHSTPFTASSGRVVGVTSFGNPEAGHVVVLVNPAGTSSPFDPDPAVTAGRTVRILSIEANSESTPLTAGDAANDIAEVLAAREPDRVGIAGWSTGGWVALALAARHPELVTRVAVVSTPAPENESIVDFALADVAAKTLLLYGTTDSVGSRHASWFLKRLPDARVEMNPHPGELEVVARWDRILSHLAPGSKPRRGVY